MSFSVSNPVIQIASNLQKQIVTVDNSKADAHDSTLTGEIDIDGCNISNKLIAGNGTLTVDPIGSVAVIGDTDLNGNTIINGTIDITGTSSITGSTIINGSLTVNGVALANINVYADAAAASVEATGNLYYDSGLGKFRLAL